MACLSNYIRNGWLSTYLLCEWTSAYLNANSISSCVKTISSSRESTASVWMLEKGRNRLLRLLRPVRTTCGGERRRGEKRGKVKEGKVREEGEEREEGKMWQRDS